MPRSGSTLLAAILNQNPRFRAGMTSPADSVLTLFNDALNDFGRLQFGGSTSSFPAIKRNGARNTVLPGAAPAAPAAAQPTISDGYGNSSSY